MNKLIKNGILLLLLLQVLPGYALKYPVNGTTNCPGHWLDVGSGISGCIAKYKSTFGDILERNNYIFPAKQYETERTFFTNFQRYGINFETHNQEGEHVGGTGIGITECDPGFSFNFFPGPSCLPEKYYLIPDEPTVEACRANPCNPVTGDKIQYEVDYVSGSLKFIRTYTTSNIDYNDKIGRGWGHSFSRQFNPLFIGQDNITASVANRSGPHATPEAACLAGWEEIINTVWGGTLSDATAVYKGGDLCEIQRSGVTIAMFRISSNAAVPFAPSTIIQSLRMPNGEKYYFEGFGSSKFDVRLSLSLQGSQWQLTNERDDKEVYDPDSGLLQSITNRQGHTTLLDYNLPAASGGDDDPTTLDKVTDHLGRSLLFTYHFGDYFYDGRKRIKTLITPDGVITYDYHRNGNLEKVTYMDGSSKTYHYENINFLYHLTGITNENGVRYATWAYDSKGRAILSEHSGGVERFDFVYNSDNTTTVTNAQGQVETFTFTPALGAQRPQSITQNYHDGNQVVNKTKTFTYYPDNGRVKEVMDYNGNITYYEYNTRGLVTLETQAKGTPEQYTVTTTWHPDYRLPTKTVYPDRAINYQYDTQGQLISRTQTTLTN